MKITHIALYTNDLARASAFYETYFGGVAGALYHNPKTGLQTYFLSFADGARLELMTRPQLGPAAEGMHVGWAHLAFQAESRAAVDALTARLQTDGYTVVSGPRVTGDGYYESCVLDPDGNTVEITA